MSWSGLAHLDCFRIAGTSGAIRMRPFCDTAVFPPVVPQFAPTPALLSHQTVYRDETLSYLNPHYCQLATLRSAPDRQRPTSRKISHCGYCSHERFRNLK